MIIAISLNHTPLLSQTPCKTEGRAACCDMFVIAGDGPKGCPSGVCTCVALGREGFRECHPAINHLGHALHETTYRREKGGGGTCAPCWPGVVPQGSLLPARQGRGPWCHCHRRQSTALHPPRRTPRTPPVPPVQSGTSSFSKMSTSLREGRIKGGRKSKCSAGLGFWVRETSAISVLTGFTTWALVAAAPSTTVFAFSIPRTRAEIKGRSFLTGDSAQSCTPALVIAAHISDV